MSITLQQIQAVYGKVYRALLTQSGTDAPVATILGTNTVGNIVWTRDAAGQYIGTLAGAFTNTMVPGLQNDTIMDFRPKIQVEGTQVSAAGTALYKNNNDTIYLWTLAASETFSDDLLSSYPIEIICY